MSTDHGSQDLGRTFIEHRTELREAARKIIGTRDGAEEVIQAAYLKVIELAAALAIRNPLSYCFQVVRHLAIDWRRRMILESHFFTDGVQGEHVPAPQGTPEQIVIDQQHLSMVRQVLESLPERTRQAFSLYRLSGLTQREIASRMGVSATLVNFMIRDATDALKQCRQMLGAE